ncbi:hypothetical protein SAMN05216428_10550 [Nitrosospira sp. Nsp11]|uniref:hypothetical protein n=1 Tax=Nitrosospira sp. Nsp11 TaxID=1855338 RepID=UPI00091D3169|nr:hypothetical protein [Nitrosospira sp. Nsp11]SHL69991.1 hypothetical protein SAMN05216428_10550 [Nitrosospira sp. Nsp11]
METRVADCPLGAKCEEVKTEDRKPILYRCPWYVQILGVDTNTGRESGAWGCAIAWLPTLMINTANESRKGVAATESFRNEMVKQGAQTQQVLLVAAQSANRKPDIKPLEQADVCE